MKELAGKRAFLTGAASGIGSALALQLAEQDTSLFLVDVDRDGLDDVAAKCAAFGVDVRSSVCDLTDRDQITATVEDALTEFGHVDLLINNAGVAFYGPTVSMTTEQWDSLMAVNLHAPIQITRELLPMLLSRPDAHIVNMCSICGIVAGGRFTAYHVSKFGLVGFTESLRAEFGRRGLGVTAICPGPVTTSLYSRTANGQSGRTAPQPPHWVCASPETVARKTIRAIRRNRRMILVTPMAHGLFQLKRFAPWVIDFMNTFSRKRLKQALFRKKSDQEPTVNERRRAA